MIGLALVVFVTIFANGLRASVSDLIDRTLAGDIAVLHDDGFTPIPAAVVPAVAKVDGVAAASPIRDTQTKIKGVTGTKNTHAIDPATIGQVYNFDWKDGSQKSLDELGLDRRPARGERRHRRRLQGRRQGGDHRARAATSTSPSRASTRTTRCSGASPWARSRSTSWPSRSACRACWSRPTRARACPPCRSA